MTTNTSCASSMRTPLHKVVAELSTDRLSPFDYDQMCLALAFIAERIYELKQKQVTTHAAGEAHYEKL